jgi:murein DD-endopeptidase MepM/ murein hydrolase activator NlpD
MDSGEVRRIPLSLSGERLQQPYFIVVLAHSLHGRLRRIHVPYSVLYTVVALAIIGAVTVCGFAASYLRMALKVSNYNDLRSEVWTLRQRYDKLRKTSEEQNKQLATFQQYASEVSTIFGLRPKMEGPASIAKESPLMPTVRESLAEFSTLRTVTFSRIQGRNQFMRGGYMPSLWPVSGSLVSFFGKRTDPFSGEGAIHTGLDISVPSGTPVRAAADGIITQAGPFAGYGRIIMVNHGGGCSTYYAHLSRFEVLPGQSVRRGDVIGYSGATGRATSPHLHYEVRMNGVPVNPYPYLMRSVASIAPKRDFAF